MESTRKRIFMSMKVRFVVLEPESKQGSHQVIVPLLIGRGEHVKFRIEHVRISRKHCEFFDDDGHLFIRDLGSTNGTQMNGETLPSKVKMPVKSGSLVRVGSVLIRIEYGIPLTTSSHDQSDETVAYNQLEHDPAESIEIHHVADQFHSPDECDTHKKNVPVIELAKEEPRESVAQDVQDIDEIQILEHVVVDSESVETPAGLDALAIDDAPVRDGPSFSFLGAENIDSNESQNAEAMQWDLANQTKQKPSADNEKLGDFFKDLK